MSKRKKLWNELRSEAKLLRLRRTQEKDRSKSAQKRVAYKLEYRSKNTPIPEPDTTEGLKKIISLYSEKVKLVKKDEISLVRIPQIDSLAMFCSLVGVATILATPVALILWLKGFVGGWIAFDIFLAFSLSGLLFNNITHHYELDLAKKTLHYIYQNPFYFERRDISLQEVFGIRTLLFTKSMKRGEHFATALILRNGVTLHIFETRCKSDYQNVFLQQMEKTKVMAECMKWPLLEHHLMQFENIAEWRSAIMCPNEFIHILWEQELASVGLSLVSGSLNKIKADITTPLEKCCLWFVIFLFGLTTFCLLFNEFKVLSEYPRLLYMLLLDAGSIVVSVLAVWKWLIDEHYVIDIELKTVSFSSRILFFKRSWEVASFSEIKSIILRRWSGNDQIDEYFGELLLANGRLFNCTDVSYDRELSKIKAFALAKLIGCQCVLEEDSEKKSYWLPTFSDSAHLSAAVEKTLANQSLSHQPDKNLKVVSNDDEEEALPEADWYSRPGNESLAPVFLLMIFILYLIIKLIYLEL
ncbi:MAG: hypothetical protein HQM09_22275 [Candidatus Riflebacteria bacterium]|nr:hypothetical protein [Candidatus Riflebacteria bacterium]